MKTAAPGSASLGVLMHSTRRVAHYQCPECGSHLVNPWLYANTVDQCPDCGSPHIVPPRDPAEKLRQAEWRTSLSRRVRHVTWIAGLALVFMFVGFVGYRSSLSGFRDSTTSSSSRDYRTNDNYRTNQQILDASPRTSSQRKQNTASRGTVNYTLVSKLREAWQQWGGRYKSREDQGSAMMVMVAKVRAGCPTQRDAEATLNYIERTIDSW